ncbi:MAG: putative esterase [Sphingobacteriales bacterium]|jgi:predicted esterase
MEITVSRKFKIGEIPSVGPAKKVLIALHGYGQRIAFFQKHFEILAQEHGYHVYLPEAPHRFYLQGFSGKIGCSWISKYERQWDIDEVNAGLNQLLNHIQNTHPNIPISTLGFSQGGHTLVRWMVTANLDFKQCILWSVDLPSDPIPTDQNHRLQKIEFAHGNDDPFFTDERIDNFKSMLKRHQLNPKIHPFIGGHHMHIPTLVQILG